MFLAAVCIVEPNQKLPRCLLTKEQLNKAVSSSDKMLLSDEKGLPVGTSNNMGGSQKYDAGRKKPSLRTTCCVIALIRHSSYVLVTQLGPTLCDPTASSVRGILQARILEWVTIAFSRTSSQPRDPTWVSCTADRFFTI